MDETAPSANGAKWGQLPKGTWVKVRSLVGTRFTLVRVNEATVHDKPSYVVSIDGGRQFSVATKGSGIGNDFAKYGLPPTVGPYGKPQEYTIEDLAQSTDPKAQAAAAKTLNGHLYKMRAL